MLYCPPNVTLSQVWIDHGISHCFIDTVATSIIFTFLCVAGGIQYGIYRKYSTVLDHRLLPKTFLFKLQIVTTLILPILAFVRFILQATVLEKRVYGYAILHVSMTVVAWPCSLIIVFLERWRALPSIPTRGHGLVLLIFWTLVFINENLAFLNLKNKAWWFALRNSSDYVEFGLFILRYVLSMTMFVVGLKAPGIPSSKDYFIYSWQQIQIDQNAPLLEENATQSETTNRRSTFSNFWKKVRLLIPFIWPKKNIFLQFRVLFCFILLALGRVANIFIPLYNKKIVNSLTLQPGESSLTYHWDFILIYVGLWFLQGQGNNSLLNNMRSVLWIRVQQYTVKEVQIRLYTHLLGLSLRWHIMRKTGEVLRVMDRGTNSITNLLSYIVFSIFPTVADILIAIVYFSSAFGLWYGLIVFVTMGLYLAATIAITEWRTKFRRLMNKMDNATQAKAVDALLNFETVKYYAAEEYEVKTYSECIDSFQAAEWKSTASLNFLNSIQNLVITLGMLVGSLLCAHAIVHKQGFTVGDYVLFTSYLLQLYTPLNYFGTYYRMIQTAFIDMENMFELFEVVPEVEDDKNAVSLQVTKGQIEFRNVYFSYMPERPILHNISFLVPPGKTLALVGPTGSGKSTIIRLLFRFYDIQSGQIIIDGQDIRKVTQKSLHENIGIVPQDTVLFNNSISYNIRYGKVTAYEEEVEEAAKAADIHSQILTFPDGYDTVVGERGLKLSGGEKQRIAIARTILKAPKFVLLDEATSSLDTRTERNIQASLALISSNKTSIIVAHRLSTIVHADEILVIKEGRIVERGRHEELLELGREYCAMWNQQLKSQSEEPGSGTEEIS
ncbi:ATP-binding cassette sub-family B member 6 [Centruroides vittatus]|uniref:ATP-binding cassette sub-family B member 6 n=1 Tax=Centruroides vittatus TaxID=120091 RepID=UPI00350F7531